LNGDRYEGDLEYLEPNGNGKLYNKQYTYAGEFQVGNFNGTGKIIYSEESEYNLSSLNDRQNTIKSTKKSKKNKLEKNSIKEYKGEFSKGKFNGKGKILFENKESYDGDFVNNSLTGNGSYYFNNGNIYQGEFMDGKFEGKGVMFFSKKCVSFTGEFVNNKPSGEGFFYDLNKTQKQYVRYDAGELISLKFQTNSETNFIFKNLIVLTPL
jgi:hypothetical protein